MFPNLLQVTPAQTALTFIWLFAYQKRNLESPEAKKTIKKAPSKHVKVFRFSTVLEGLRRSFPCHQAISLL